MLQVGQRIKSVKEIDCISFPAGSIGTIVEVNNDLRSYRVEFTKKNCSCIMWLTEFEVVEVKSRGTR